MERTSNENSFLRQQLAIKQRSMLVDIPESNFFNSFASPASIDTNIYHRNNSNYLFYYYTFFRTFENFNYEFKLSN